MAALTASDPQRKQSSSAPKSGPASCRASLRACELRFELQAVGAVVDPFTGRRDPLAGRNGCRMPNDSHDIAVTTRLGAQNAEAILDIVVSDALDEAGQDVRG